MERIIFAAAFFVPMICMATPNDGHEQRMADEARAARREIQEQCLRMRTSGVLFGTNVMDMFRLAMATIPCCVDPNLPQCGVPVKEHFDKRRFDEPECPDC